jgi:hypothetical protein
MSKTNRRSTFEAPSRIEKIKQSDCPTCKVPAGKRCISVITGKPTVWHVGRKQKALLS